MLKSYLFTFQFFRYVQTGMYIDFFLKKFIEIFVKNYFILTAQFFGEKYIIEFITKKVIDSWLFNNNKFLGFFEFFMSLFFVQFISFLFLFFSIIIIFI